MITGILTLGAALNFWFLFAFAKRWSGSVKELREYAKEKRQITATLHDLHKRTLRQNIKFTVVFFVNFLLFSVCLFSKIFALLSL